MRIVKYPGRTARRQVQPINGHHAENGLAWQRKSQLFDIAFLVLGGRKAAQAFLYGTQAGLAQTPMATAMNSPLGLIEAVRLLRRAV